MKCCLLFCTTWTRKDIFIMKLCRNLCWFSWLKFNLKRVSNFAPIMNVMLKMPCLIRDAKTKLVWWNLADNAQTSNILTLSNWLIRFEYNIKLRIEEAIIRLDFCKEVALQFCFLEKVIRKHMVETFLLTTASLRPSATLPLFTLQFFQYWRYLMSHDIKVVFLVNFLVNTSFPNLKSKT